MRGSIVEQYYSVASRRFMKKLIGKEHPMTYAIATATGTIVIERRGKERVKERFPINIRGKEKNGDDFELQTVTENISATGLYIHMEKRVKRGASLFMIVNLSGLPGKVLGPRVALRGTVRRIEQLSPSCYGVGVSFSSHRFL